MVWCRMPMGHRDAPAAFQMVAEWLCSAASETPNQLFPVCQTTEVRKYLCYLDDFTIVTTSGGWREHLGALMAFLKKLKHHGFTLRADKCKFCRTRVKLLGHIGTGEGGAPRPEYTNNVEQFRNFSTVKQLQSFLGLVGYYRQYIPSFVQVTTPLRDAMEAGKATKSNG